MDFPQSAGCTVHLLSKKSRRLHRDTFFFLPYLTGPLLAGLNQRLTPVSCAKLHRWVHMIDPNALEFELQPVTIKKSIGILSYRKVPVGSSIPADSMIPLPPGDYAWNVTGTGVYITPFESFWEEASFADLKSGAEKPGRLEHLAKYLPWYHIPSLLGELVTTRDSGRCLITGSVSIDTEIDISWIFPPAWAKWLDHPMYRENHSAISIPSNTMLMRKDLIPAFHDNAFGIDVDDDYRLIIFRDFGAPRELLTGSNFQAYFRRPGFEVQLTGPDDYFLREHFKHCLRVHLLHGSITDDYPQTVVVSALEELGVWDEDDEPAPFDDPRWHTELGREILECHFLMQLGSGDESPFEDDI